MVKAYFGNKKAQHWQHWHITIFGSLSFIYTCGSPYPDHWHLLGWRSSQTRRHAGSANTHRTQASASNTPSVACADKEVAHPSCCVPHVRAFDTLPSLSWPSTLRLVASNFGVSGRTAPKGYSAIFHLFVSRGATGRVRIVREPAAGWSAVDPYDKRQQWRRPARNVSASLLSSLLIAQMLYVIYRPGGIGRSLTSCLSFFNFPVLFLFHGSPIDLIS